VQIDDDATDLASRIFIYLFFCLDFLEAQGRSSYYHSLWWVLEYGGNLQNKFFCIGL
jgi:hypothetical protein